MKYYLRQLNADHAAILQGWLKARGICVADKLPATGCVAYSEEGHPIAAGALRAVEGGYAQFDGLVTNPQSPPGDRDAATDAVIEHLLMRGRQLNFKGIMAASGDENTIVRAQKHGFVKLPLTLLAVDLSSRRGI